VVEREIIGQGQISTLMHNSRLIGHTNVGHFQRFGELRRGLNKGEEKTQSTGKTGWETLTSCTLYVPYKASRKTTREERG